MAASSHILLKNTDGALPLKAPKKLVMIGSDAGPPPNGPNGFSDRGGVSGTLAMGWGSGYVFLIFTPALSVAARSGSGD